MRFKASIRNINTFTRLTASLSSLGKDVWLQLNTEQLRFTVVPEQGSQVWAVLAIDTIFDTYLIQSAVENNTINLRIPLGPLHRALRSALNAISASIRLTKKDNIPLLSLTIITTSLHTWRPPHTITTTTLDTGDAPLQIGGSGEGPFGEPNASAFSAHDRETTITQDVPVIVLAAATVASIHEPQCPQPDVHIMLPSLLQLKAISERFTKLALSTSTGAARGRATDAPSSQSRLILSANAHGVLRIGVETPALKIESKWEGLTNPELDPEQIEGGEEGIKGHASTRMKEMEGEESWSVVRVEGRDWGRVLGVGRLGGRVIACFCHEHALILYVYLSNDDSESVLTVDAGVSHEAREALEALDIRAYDIKHQEFEYTSYLGASVTESFSANINLTPNTLTTSTTIMPRYIKHQSLPTLPPPDPTFELLSSLTKLTIGYPPRPAWSAHDLHGLYSGPTSIAYLFLHLSKQHPTLIINEKRPLQWCKAYLSGTRAPTTVSASRCGIGCETLSFLAVSAAVMGEAGYIERFLSHIPAILNPLEGSEGSTSESNEWLYGRAGTLYLLRLMRHFTTSPFPTPTTTAAINAALTNLTTKILSSGPPWSWHGKCYHGAAHGSIGIVTQILLSSPSTPWVQKLLLDLLALQTPSGNWPSSAESKREGEGLVQFCHGAPGFIVSLLSLRRILLTPPTNTTTEDENLLERINRSIEKGRAHIYNRGLLTKQPCLCHGAIGNALALEGQQRAVFMRWCQMDVVKRGTQEGRYHKGDDEWGLYCGEAGRAWDWLVAGSGEGEGEGEGRVIGYNDV